MSLTVALSKGKLLSGSEALFRNAGLPFPDGEGRRLVVEAGSLRFLFVKDMDVPTYVEYGVADCGVAGRDVLLETGADVLEPLDLGLQLRRHAGELGVAARVAEVRARLPPLVRESLRCLELLEPATRVRSLTAIVVDRRVGHALLRLGVRALELLDQVFDRIHPVDRSRAPGAARARRARRRA